MPSTNQINKQNPHYRIYTQTKKQLANNTHLKLEDYYWNRWAISGLNNERLAILQSSMDEIAPSWETTIRLAEIRPLDENELNELPNAEEPINISGRWDEEVDFSGFIFASKVNFQSSKFLENARFSRCKFFGDAIFDKTEFCKNAYFGGARFVEKCSFLRVKFNSLSQAKNQFDTRFIEAVFSKKTSFFEAQFFGRVNFFGALFSGEINRFMGCEFKNKNTYFYGALFESNCNFADAKFEKLPDLSACEFRGGTNINGINLIGTDDDPLGGLKKTERVGFKETSEPAYEEAIVAWALFRKTAKENDDPQGELKFFKKELGVRKINPRETKVARMLIHLYEVTSDYGMSITRPTIFFALQLIFFAVIYSLASAVIVDSGVAPEPTTDSSTMLSNQEPPPDKETNNSETGYASFSSALQLSLYNSFLLIFSTGDDSYYKNMLAELFGDDSVANRYIWYLIVENIQKLLAIISFFLIGLWIRNQLRLG